MKDKFAQFEFDGELGIVEEETTPPTRDQSAETPAEAPTEEPYTGSERRSEHRRKGGDRRSEVRFEPGKDDRRSGKDRRKGVWDGKYTV